MSNVVYKGKGQVPLYRIYRHSITPWGPREGQGKPHSALGTAALIPGKVLGGRRLGSQEHPHPVPVSAPASARLPFLCLPPPPTPYKEPQELRLRRGSCPWGHVPHVWEKKYTPLNTEHMGEGGDTTGGGKGRQAPQEVDGPSPQPARRRHCSQVILTKEENHTTKGAGTG